MTQKVEGWDCSVCNGSMGLCLRAKTCPNEVGGPPKGEPEEKFYGGESYLFYGGLAASFSRLRVA